MLRDFRLGGFNFSVGNFEGRGGLSHKGAEDKDEGLRGRGRWRRRGGYMEGGRETIIIAKNHIILWHGPPYSKRESHMSQHPLKRSPNLPKFHG